MLKHQLSEGLSHEMETDFEPTKKLNLMHISEETHARWCFTSKGIINKCDMW